MGVWSRVTGSFLLGAACVYSEDFPLRNVAHLELACERRFGASRSDVEKVNNILSGAKNCFLEKNPIKQLKSIDGLLASSGLHPGKKGGDLLSEGLREGCMDCDLFTSLYIAIAQEYDLPLVAVEFPGHVAVRLRFGNGERVGWETTQG